MSTLYIDTCSNVYTVVSHRTVPLYIKSLFIEDCPLRQIEYKSS